MATIYDAVVAGVVDDTGRPEMAVADSTGTSLLYRRIQRAITLHHRIDFWKKDFLEQPYIFQLTQAVQILNLLQFPYLRAVGYIRKYDPTSINVPFDPTNVGLSADFFKEINPQLVMDGYGYDKLNTFYRAGSTLKLLSSEAISAVNVGWFRDPIVEPLGNSNSWILVEYSELLIAYLKQRIFADIGKDEEAKRSKDDYELQLNTFLANNIRVAVLQQ